jgi:hypothetical protein
MARKDPELEAALRGQTPEQQKLIKYFMAPDGCFSKNISDEEYEKIVWDKINLLNLKQRALDRAGFDEYRVNEIPPVELRHWHFGEKALKKRGLDGLFRSSAYQVTWLFFTVNLVFIYQYTLFLNKDEKNERVGTYFYRDITGLSLVSESEETEYRESGRGCLSQEPSGGRKFINHDVFYLITGTEKFGCDMLNTDETVGKIRAMRAKLWEKNG